MRVPLTVTFNGTPIVSWLQEGRSFWPGRKQDCFLTIEEIVSASRVFWCVTSSSQMSLSFAQTDTCSLNHQVGGYRMELTKGRRSATIYLTTLVPVLEKDTIKTEGLDSLDNSPLTLAPLVHSHIAVSKHEGDGPT